MTRSVTLPSILQHYKELNTDGLMKSGRTKKYGSFQALGRRKIVTDFSGGTITSDDGGLLLREIELRTAILRRFAGCITDYRNEKLIEHSVLSLVFPKSYRPGPGIRRPQRS